MFSNVFHSSASPTPPVSRPLTPIEGGNVAAKPVAKLETNQNIKKCPFEKHGCKFVGNCLAIQEHMRDKNDVHISMLGEMLQPFQNEIHQGLATIKVTNQRAEKLENVSKTLSYYYSSAFLWHIENYPKKYLSAKEEKKIFVESPSFLSHRFGYNLKVSIAPSGDLETSRIFSSIYVTIMPGYHDAILEWPFKATIVFTIIDRKGSDNFVAKLVPEITTERMASLVEPSNDANMKFGLQKFIAVEEMEDGGKYVKNGHAFIAIDFENLSNSF